MTPDELEQLATPLSIRIRNAALRRDVVEVAAVSELVRLEFPRIFGTYVRWLDLLQGEIVRHSGESELAHAMTAVAEHGTRPFVEHFRGASVRDVVLRLGGRLRSSGRSFRLVEDERRVRFELDPIAERRRTRVSSLRGLTRDGPDSAAVMVPELQFLEGVPIDLFGAPLAVVTLSDSREDIAHLDVYKDSTDIEETVYARWGQTKPSVAVRASRDLVLTDVERARLGRPLGEQIQIAADERDWDELVRISAGMDAELVCAKDPLGITLTGLLTWIARHQGEDMIEEVLMRVAPAIMDPYIDRVAGLSPAERIRTWASSWRAHGSTFWIEEHDETFVFRGNPLGACHRMWLPRSSPEIRKVSGTRVKYPSFGCYAAPVSMHLMSTPSAITAGASGFPIYSCHCHVLHTIYPIDRVGHPLWFEEHAVGTDDDTVHIHYKDQQEWPEHYFQRVGRSKTLNGPSSSMRSSSAGTVTCRTNEGTRS